MLGVDIHTCQSHRLGGDDDGISASLEHYTIDRAKRSLCPDNNLSDWSKQSSNANGGSSTVKSVTTSSVTLGGQVWHDNTERLIGAAFDDDEYGDTLPNVPSVLTGCCDDWKAFQSSPNSWSVQDLARRYAPLVSLDGGPSQARMSLCSAMVSLTEYGRYCRNAADGDDAPLYVFDADFLKPNSTFSDGSAVAGEFTVPPCFSRDQMACCNRSRFRPLPPGWLLAGAARSGTPIHNHPMTVAWNALLTGCKLWCCLPPDVSASALLLNLDQQGGAQDEGKRDDDDDDDNEEDDAFDLSALEWFEQCGELPENAHIIVQQPGEVVFLPAGWFHVVFNVETSTAISVSLTLRKDLPLLLPLLAESDAEFATFWTDQLAAQRR